MSVVFGCPRCGKPVELEPGSRGPCPACRAEAALPATERLELCLACGGELYRHRDFNQKLGLGLVAAGAVLWFATGSFWWLLGLAVLDLVLYLVVGDVAICYACKAHHRGLPGIAELPAFDLERHEHHRFLRARAEGRIPPRKPD